MKLSDQTKKSSRPIKLSARELGVAKMLEEGYKTNDIALFFDIHSKTVSTYIGRIYRKCGLDRSKNTYLLVIKLKEKSLLKTQSNVIIPVGNEGTIISDIIGRCPSCGGIISKNGIFLEHNCKTLLTLKNKYL